MIICVTGMPGAGKSTVATAISKLGFASVNMGDVIREQAEKRGLPVNEENLGKVMLELREKKGLGAVAELCLPRIDSSRSKRVVVDGARSFDEVKVFQRIAEVKVLAVHASQKTRYLYLTKRRRTDAPLSWESFLARDQRELQVGLSNIIALSDEVISNNGITLKELKSKAMGIAKKWTDSVES